MSARLERLRCAWWNTGLTPRSRNAEAIGPVEADLAAVVRVIDVLGEMLSLDMIALGESSPEVVDTISSLVRRPYRTYVDLEDRTGLSLLYREESLALLGSEVMTERYADKTLKRTCHLRLKTTDDSLDFNLFICHWPSRMQSSGEMEREALANAVASKLESHRVQKEARPTFVVGDFNDEPFDQSMSQKLLGSRDRSLVRKRTSLLYNPFWRILGEQQHLSQESSGRLAAGTYYYGSSADTHWLTVDQALCSKEFLGGGKWVLDEESTTILQHPELVTEEGRIRKPFDHLPIMIAFCRVPE